MNEKRLFRITLKLYAKRMLFQNLRDCIAATLFSMSLMLLGNLLAQRFLPDLRVLETTLDLTPYLPQVLRYYAVLLSALLLSAPLTMGFYAWLSELSMNRKPRLREIFNWFGDLRMAAKAFGAVLWFGVICVFQAVIHLALPIGLMLFISKRVDVMGAQSATFLIGLLTLLLAAGIGLMLARVLVYLPAQYLLASHPEMRIREAYAQCRKFMSGRHWEFLFLVGSFLFWFYLESLSGGILTFFVQPYFTLSVLLFTQEARTRWMHQMGRTTPDPAWTPSSAEEEEEPYV